MTNARRAHRDILDVPSLATRPHDVFEHPEYDRLRPAVISFLEATLNRRSAPDTGLDSSPSAPQGRRHLRVFPHAPSRCQPKSMTQRDSNRRSWSLGRAVTSKDDV